MYLILSIFNIPKETFTQVRGINVTQQTVTKCLLFARQQSLYQGIPCSVTFKSKSLPVHSNMICFVKFSCSVYTHSQGIDRFPRVRNFILKRSKKVKLAMFTRGMGRGSTEGATGSRKSEASCSVWILAPTFSGVWPWASYLAFLPCHFHVCETWTLTFLPHTGGMSFMSREHLEQFLAHNRFHMGVTYYFVQKLLHCSLFPLY